jgi:hypothetical protein
LGILRTAIDLLTGENESFSSGADPLVAQAIDYFNLRTDRAQVKEAYIPLYGTELVTEQDPVKRTNQVQTYAKPGFTALVDNDMIEAMSIGFGQKVVNAKATLFTEPGNKFSLIHENEDTDVKPAEALLFKNRTEGNAKTTLVRADKLSLEVGSAAVLLSFANDTVTYQHFDPNSVKAYFGDIIEENGKPRAVDRSDVEDATKIVIRLGQVDVDKWNYLAIFGRSNTYPSGRWVTYQEGDSAKVPEPYETGVIEFEIEGKMANPMSYYANTHPDENVPEYPISIIYSGMTENTGEMMPITTSLYRKCIEFSRAASHTLSTSQDAAAGCIGVETTSEGRNAPIPKSYNKFRTFPGQTVVSHDRDSSSQEAAYSILKGLMIDAAGGFSVPDYMVVSEDHTLDASSGIALEVKTRPLIQDRQNRIDENAASVRKIFEIEKAYISLFSTAKEGDINLLEECEQKWDAGPYNLPENKLEAAQRITAMTELGLMDTIEGIRQYYRLPDDVEAKEMYRKMEERAEEFPPLNQPDEPETTTATPGLRRRIANGQV